ncbi:MAG TPA: carbohydrate ABC transporter permease [Mesotoga sp.]|nr:carbohydrate ABC transporter permease [Mesotoga sp.]MDI9376248.1 carbohydrate ABC transporter permease [Thermotogota bacterium]NLX32733.1 carbohydrate ABC transporter permease [Thermotogaceae bacterium]MDD4040592.1 carbohydrate ABC transporter permease [Mesotoga sp.]MDD4479495.1 carbohydrate ABC transporter permease [Mesotoga sp.]
MNVPRLNRKVKTAAGMASVYFTLLLIGFVFIYPVIYIISYSFMDTEDLVNPLVRWLPTKLYIGNFSEAASVLDFSATLIKTLIVTVLPSILQTISASIVGYGFSRFRFPGKKIMLAALLATFIIPPQVTMIPQFLMFRDLKLLETIWAFILPATFTQGIRSAIFVLIFYQFFNMLPRSLEEAAKIDGASTFRIFYRIAVPSATPAYIIAFLFSLVWYWNETTLTALYLGEKWATLPLKLQNFAVTFRRLYPADPYSVVGKNLNEAIVMAGTFLTLIPLLMIYFFTQSWFVESIDRTGITGE